MTYQIFSVTGSFRNLPLQVQVLEVRTPRFYYHVNGVIPNSTEEDEDYRPIAKKNEILHLDD